MDCAGRATAATALSSARGGHAIRSSPRVRKRCRALLATAVQISPAPATPPRRSGLFPPRGRSYGAKKFFGRDSTKIPLRRGWRAVAPRLRRRGATLEISQLRSGWSRAPDKPRVLKGRRIPPSLQDVALGHHLPGTLSRANFRTSLRDSTRNGLSVHRVNDVEPFAGAGGGAVGP